MASRYKIGESQQPDTEYKERLRQAEKLKKQSGKRTIAQIAKEAKERGLSYGVYVAMMED